MFHSSSSRHEQYLIRSNSSKATLHKKRSSLESENSGADSGYTSSSSSSPTTTTAPPLVAVTIPSTENFSNQVIQEANINPQFLKKSQTPSIADTTTSSTSTIITNGAPKKKRSKRHQSNRQPDLVYSCPRPLAFPFHNDDHFLPIAEADPRDVARVSPSLNRTSSFQSSSKTSVGSTRMYDNSQYSASSHRSAKSVDGASAYSQQSSILSTIQRGTVRSIRSFFQLPDSLSRVDTRQTNYSTQSSQTGLPRLEIKQGTVQSIKSMFSLKRSNLQSQRVTSTLQPKQQQKGRVGTTISQYESSTSLPKASQTQSLPKSQPQPQQPQQPKQKQASATTLSSVQEQLKSKPKGYFASRATKFASRALWMPKTPQEASSVTQSSVVKPLPKPTPQPTEQEIPQKKTLKSEVKKISARMFSWTKDKNKVQDIKAPVTAPVSGINPSLPRSTSIKSTRSTLSTASTLSPPPPSPPAPPKRSIFSAFRRSDKSSSTLVDDSKKKIKSTETNEDVMSPPPTTTTTVGKMWKSFKNLVTGKKSSRVGVL